MAVDLRGTFLPVTTPFDPVTGDVDVVAYRANLRRWFEHPLSGILIAGSTGESVLLDQAAARKPPGTSSPKPPVPPSWAPTPCWSSRRRSSRGP
jgi:hypothetical protein